MNRFKLFPRFENALWISMLILVGIGSLYILGNFIIHETSRLSDRHQATPTPNMEVLSIQQDILTRMRAYYQEFEAWPGEGIVALKELGLNQNIGSSTQHGLQWQVAGDCLGMTNDPQDDLQIYVQNLEGEDMHLYDGWTIWCPVLDQQCYYHTVAPGNEIDLNSIRVTQ